LIEEKLPPTFILFLADCELKQRRQKLNKQTKPNHGNNSSSVAMTNFPTASLEQCTDFDKILLGITFIAALIAVYNVIIQSKLSNKVAEKED